MNITADEAYLLKRYILDLPEYELMQDAYGNDELFAEMTVKFVKKVVSSMETDDIVKIASDQI